MTLTAEDLTEIEARVDAATDGPWKTEKCVCKPGCLMSYITHPQDAGVSYFRTTDADFIAHGREDIPALITALKEAWADNERLKDLLSSSEDEVQSLKEASAQEVAQAYRAALEAAAKVNDQEADRNLAAVEKFKSAGKHYKAREAAHCERVVRGMAYMIRALPVAKDVGSFGITQKSNPTAEIIARGMKELEGGVE